MGINLLPSKGKLCNFDCIYCECGFNADGREDKQLPSAARVRSMLENKLCDCMLQGVKIDSITFSGDGEPTLNPEFPRIIEDTLTLRDAFYPGTKVSVLTNASTLDRPGVFEALRKVDNPIMKLDAPTTELARKINRAPLGYDVAAVIEGLSRFGSDFVLQTMFLRCPEFDSSAPAVLKGWSDIVRFLRPREIMVYTVDRPTPVQGIEKFTEDQMRSMVEPLLKEGFKIQIKG